MATNTGKKARKAKTAVVNNWPTQVEEVKPLNFAQEQYLNAIKQCDVVLGVGSAGSGKTFIPVSYAAEQLFYKYISKIIISRPVVEMGKSLGYIPGELDEKYRPYLEPFESTFIDILGKGFYDYCLDKKVIEPKPLAFLRGTTFSDCIVLIDEVQNMTKKEFYGVLTRIGKNCKIILSGDNNINQVDISNSGLNDAIGRLREIPSIEIINFLPSDSVRSSMCRKIIKAYES